MRREYCPSFGAGKCVSRVVEVVNGYCCYVLRKGSVESYAVNCVDCRSGVAMCSVNAQGRRVPASWLSLKSRDGGWRT
jgi:hypothetical protein